MDTFESDFQTKSEELVKNLKTFLEKDNNAAGSRTRKNAQELKKMLQELRVQVLAKQKENKEKKGGAKKGGAKKAAPKKAAPKKAAPNKKD